MNEKLKNLSITQKMVLVISASILLLASTLYFVASTVNLKSYLSIENEAILEDLNRADDAIKNLFPQLTVKLHDWASWDDTYQFVKDLNEQYRESNLGAYNLANLEIDAMIFANAAGEVVFIRVVDSQTGEAADPTEIERYFESHRELVTHPNTESSIAGILHLPEGPFLFTSLPILTSEGEGPIHGSLTFGKYLDKNLIDSIGILTHLTVEAFPYGDAWSPSDIITAEEHLNTENSQHIQPLSEESIATYRILSDYYGKPLITLRVQSPRDVYRQGQSTFSFYMVATSVLLFMFSLILIVLLELFVVSRFTKLDKDVKLIAEKNDLSIRIKEGAKDEIGDLASSINRLLDKIVAAEKAENASNEKVLLMSEELKERLEETEKINKMMINRELKMMELKEELKKLKKEG